MAIPSTIQTMHFTLRGNTRKQWEDNEENRIETMNSLLQQRAVPSLNSLIGKRIKYCVEFDVDEDNGTTSQSLLWCGGVLKKVSNGRWRIPGRRKCYAKGEAAGVFWDAIPVHDIGNNVNICI